VAIARHCNLKAVQHRTSHSGLMFIYCWYVTWLDLWPFIYHICRSHVAI